MSVRGAYTTEELALFAMQLLPETEAAEIAPHVRMDGEARKELARIQGELAVYACTVERQSPPTLTRGRLMKRIGREKKAAPVERVTENTGGGGDAAPALASGLAPDLTPDLATSSADGGSEGEQRTLSHRATSSDEPMRRGATARVLPWVGWAVAAGMAAMAGDLYRQRQSLQGEVAAQVAAQAKDADRLTVDTAAATEARQALETLTDSSAMRVTLTKENADAAPQGNITYVASKGSLIFVANGLEALPPEKTYELWLIPATEDGTPVPAGMFLPDKSGNGRVVLPPLPKGVEAKAFGVTVEEKEGAATPTLPIVLAGEKD